VTLRSTADELADAFDAGFAAPVHEPEPTVDVIAVRIGAHAFALRALELTALHLAGRIVPLPTRAPPLLGLAGIRGALVPVYDLAALVGGEPDPGARWLVLVGRPIVGLAFAAFDRQLRVPVASVVPTEDRLARAIVAIDGHPTPILDLAAIHREIVRLAAGRETAG
jgi:chemotaxis signal transduction protein